LYFVMGVILGLFGIIWGIAKWAESIESGIPASTGTVLLAVLPIILAVQFLTQAVAQDIADIPTKIQHNKVSERTRQKWDFETKNKEQNFT